jgi:hypothetical protein
VAARRECPLHVPGRAVARVSPRVPERRPPRHGSPGGSGAQQARRLWRTNGRASSASASSRPSTCSSRSRPIRTENSAPHRPRRCPRRHLLHAFRRGFRRGLSRGCSRPATVSHQRATYRSIGGSPKGTAIANAAATANDHRSIEVSGMKYRLTPPRRRPRRAGPAAPSSALG